MAYFRSFLFVHLWKTKGIRIEQKFSLQRSCIYKTPLTFCGKKCCSDAEKPLPTAHARARVYADSARALVVKCLQRNPNRLRLPRKLNSLVALVSKGTFAWVLIDRVKVLSEFS